MVIFSPHFLSKNWPKAELNALFTREMDGHTVILPIWHNISSAEMKAAFPIQADKVALRSSAGLQAVARALVEVIQPELLEVETQRDRAFDSAESLLDIAKKHHPGLRIYGTFGDAMHADRTGNDRLSDARDKPNRRFDFRSAIDSDRAKTQHYVH